MQVPVLGKSHVLRTSHGSIAIEEAGDGDVPILLVHGNSSCRGIFGNQMAGSLTSTHRLIAMDLPGHGDSEDALDPGRTYTRPGFADAVLEVLRQLAIDRVVMLGWSLGGHIGIEMLSRSTAIGGLMICGSAAALTVRQSKTSMPTRRRHS